MAVGLAMSLAAQPSIPADSAEWVRGSSFDIVEIGNATSFNIGGSGETVLWNYESMVGGTSYTMSVDYVDSSGLGDPILSQMKVTVEKGILQDYTWYFTNHSNRMTYFGFLDGVTPSSFDETPAVIWRYPIEYGDRDTTEIDSHFETGLFAKTQHDLAGTVISHVDAYGRMVMPYGDVYNVLRIHINENYVDTMTPDSGPVTTQSHTNDIWEWRNMYNGAFIMRFEKRVAGSTKRTVWFLDGNNMTVNPGPAPVGFEFAGQDLPEFIISPNPTADVLNVSFNAVQGEKSTIEVRDLQGRLLMNEAFVDDRTGARIESMDVSKLTPGTYIVHYQSAGDSHLKRFVKQ